VPIEWRAEYDLPDPQRRWSASRRIATICSSVNRVFFMAPHRAEGAILSSFSWSENRQAGQRDFRAAAPRRWALLLLVNTSAAVYGY
jgi:hypothetical protein